MALEWVSQHSVVSLHCGWQRHSTILNGLCFLMRRCWTWSIMTSFTCVFFSLWVVYPRLFTSGSSHGLSAWWETYSTITDRWKRADTIRSARGSVEVAQKLVIADDKSHISQNYDESSGFNDRFIVWRVAYLRNIIGLAVLLRSSCCCSFSLWLRLFSSVCIWILLPILMAVISW